MNFYLSISALIVAGLLPFQPSALQGQSDLQQRAVVEGTRVIMAAPQHFTVADQFHGFMHANSSSSILVQEIPDAVYLNILPGLTPEHFQNEGATLIEKGELYLNSGKSGNFFIVSFIIKEIEFRRIMFFTGDLKDTIWINANYPASAEILLKEILLKSMKTVSF